MRTPVFLNESPTLGELGDLRLFESVDALREHVEPIDVEHGEYFAFDAEGRLLALYADARHVGVEAAEPEPRHASVLAGLLREDLAAKRYPDGRPAAVAVWREAASLGELVARARDVDAAWRQHGRNGLASSLVATARRWLAPG